MYANDTTKTGRAKPEPNPCSTDKPRYDMAVMGLGTAISTEDIRI
jgi:hypothetical protein